MHQNIYPSLRGVAPELPLSAQKYLQQAIAGLALPDGAAVLAASAVDTMLKSRGLIDGTLNSRIKQAAAQHLITAEMADWADEVRVGANEVRHADVQEPHKTPEEARRLVEFAEALGDFLFVFPARVAAGRAARAK